MGMTLFWVCMGLIGVSIGGGIITDCAIRMTNRKLRVFAYAAAYLILLVGLVSLIVMAIS